MQSKPVMVVTGARKGIGRHLVSYYADYGFHVVGCGRGEGGIDNYGNSIEYVSGIDIADEDLVMDFFGYVRGKHERLDVLINNAGVASMNHSLLTPIDTVKRLTDTNFIGTFLCCREAAKIMQFNKWGRIVNFSSIAIPLSLEGESIYAATKSAVETLTKILAKELATFGITVNTIGPSPVATDLIKGVQNYKLDKVENQLAIKRIGTFDDITNVIDFFIRPESNFISGQIIYLGGVS